MTRIRALLGRLLPQGAILLSVLFLASYVAGLLRVRVFARTYGAGMEFDAYVAAFVLPELALDVLVASGLTAPFVPIFNTLRRDDPDAAPRFAQTVLTLAVVVIAIACLVMLLAAPLTVGIVAGNFPPEGQALYLDLFRLMLVTPIIFAASITLGEVLIAERRFLFYALAPLLYNLGIVLGTLLLHDALGIRAAAVGAIIGALMHLGIRMVGMIRSPVPIRFRLDVHMPAVREFIRLMIPKMLSHPIEPLTFLYFTIVAGTLAAGSIAAVDYARNFQSVPVSLIGASIAVAAFPVLSASWAAGDRAGFRRDIVRNAITIGSVTVVAAIALVLVGPLAIEVLLGGGRFDSTAVAATAAVLAAFALSVPFESLSHLSARALYATHNTVLAVLGALAGLGVTVAVTQLLVGSIGVIAIPLGFAAGSAVKVVLQGVALAWRIRHAPPPVDAAATASG